MKPIENRWPVALVVLLAGALLPLGFAPLNAWWLLPPVLAVPFWLWGRVTPLRAAWLGWLFGLGMFGVGVSWVYVSIHDMGHLSLWLAGFITALFVGGLALFPALLGWLLAWLRRLPRSSTERHLVASTLLLMPAAWVLMEWLRGWLFTGFPWLCLGHSQVDGPLAPLLPVAGSLAASWLLALAGAALVLVFQLRRRWRSCRRWLSVPLLLWLSVGLLPGDWTQPDGDSLSFSLVQGGRPQQLRWDSGQRQRSVNHYLQLTEQEWGRDLVVWPENALPIFYHRIAPLRRMITQRLTEDGGHLLIGMPVMELASGHYYNSAVMFPEPVGRYDKRHLVPFTEYLPLKRWLQAPLDFFKVPMSDFSAGAGGDGAAALEAGGVAIAVSICYESAYIDEVFRALPNAALLVNLSNDGWFGDTLGPHQHLQIARVRAAEAGRWMLRATNTGITALIDAGGRLVAQAPRFTPAVLRGEVTAMTGATPYVRWRNTPVLGLMLCLILLGLWLGRSAPTRRTGV